MLRVCLRAFQCVSHENALMFVIHKTKFWAVCGTNKFYGGGSELSNHTLHSLARNLITYKQKAPSLGTNILKRNLGNHTMNK